MSTTHFPIVVRRGLEIKKKCWCNEIKITNVSTCNCTGTPNNLDSIFYLLADSDLQRCGCTLGYNLTSTTACTILPGFRETSPGTAENINECIVCASVHFQLYDTKRRRNMGDKHCIKCSYLSNASCVLLGRPLTISYRKWSWRASLSFLLFLPASEHKDVLFSFIVESRRFRF